MTNNVLPEVTNRSVGIVSALVKVLFLRSTKRVSTKRHADMGMKILVCRCAFTKPSHMIGTEMNWHDKR